MTELWQLGAFDAVNGDLNAIVKLIGASATAAAAEADLAVAEIVGVFTPIDPVPATMWKGVTRAE